MKKLAVLLIIAMLLIGCGKKPRITPYYPEQKKTAKKYDTAMNAIMVSYVALDIADVATTLRLKNKCESDPGIEFIEKNPVDKYFLEKGDTAYVLYRVGFTVAKTIGVRSIYKKNKKAGIVVGLILCAIPAAGISYTIRW